MNLLHFYSRGTRRGGQMVSSVSKLAIVPRMADKELRKIGPIVLCMNNDADHPTRHRDHRPGKKDPSPLRQPIFP